MSRRVVDIGGILLRGRAAPTNQLWTAHPTPRIGLVAPRVAVRQLSASHGVRAGGVQASRCATGGDVAVPDPRVRWARPAAPVAARVGLGRGLHIACNVRILFREEGLVRCTAIQRRWRSVTKPRTEESVSKPSDEPTSGAKATSDHSGSRQQYILDRLPHLHRPSKEELLAAATGFWHRLSIRFKWFSIRSARPFNSDEIGAFLSWIFWGHVLWVVIGTTTFVSGAIWAINTVFAQETLAGWVGNYLTKSSGVQIVFESAIVPTWKSGVITFNNVFVSRRPTSQQQQGAGKRRQRAVSKGSSTAAAEAANLASLSKDAAATGKHADDAANNDDEVETNFTQFDLTIRTVAVTLSFTKWFNGKGLLRDVEVSGIRGVVDRTSIVHPPSDAPPIDPKSYRHEHHTGDFELDSFRMEDVLITVYQPREFRPFTVSVYNCELPRLRKQWLFYDFMCANNMSGSFDGSLFTIHPRQVHGGVSGGMTLASQHGNSTPASVAGGAAGEVGRVGQWKKHSRLRIDGLKIDHLNRGVSGPFSWIQEGNVDIVADVMIPHDEDGSLAKVVSDFYERVEEAVTAQPQPQPLQQQQQQQQREEDGNTIRHREVDREEAGVPKAKEKEREREKEPHDHNERFLVLDLRVHLNDIKASIPLLPNPDLSYINTTLTRPIVAYLNTHGSFVPVTCRITKPVSEFDGSWTIFDSGLLEDMSREMYGAFVRDIGDERRRRRRMRKVGLWGVRVAAQALFLGLAGGFA